MKIMTVVEKMEGDLEFFAEPEGIERPKEEILRDDHNHGKLG